MYKKDFLSVLVLVILFVCPVISADDSEDGGMSKKDEQTIEKKRFLPWLLKDFKITNSGAELSVTKEKADYYDLLLVGDPVLESQTVKLTTDKYNELSFCRIRPRTSETVERAVYLYLCYDPDGKEEEGCDDFTILKDLLKQFPQPLKVIETYLQYYSQEEMEERKLEAPVQMELMEKLYVFPVEKAEREKFLSLVPENQYTAEFYNGFVVLHRIYSKEEAEKRKMFLLNTNGKGKGLWDMVEEHKGPRNISVDIKELMEKLYIL